MTDLASVEERIEPRFGQPQSPQSQSPQSPRLRRPPSQAGHRKPGLQALSSSLRSYIISPFARLMPLAFGCAVVAALFYGWANRNEGHLSAETGPGYWLGITGATMMMLLLLYPLRKRLRSWRGLGRLAGWFRLHMFLGIAGPVLIIFHANFKLGSMNSAMAMLSMLAVAASGLVGRYLYAKIHMGLYGQKAELEAILADAHELKLLYGADMSFAPVVHEVLQRFERHVLVLKPNVFASIGAVASHSLRARHCRRELLAQTRRINRKIGRANGLSWWARRKQMKAAKYHIDLYFTALRKAARLALYERLFGLWHVLHLPLFVVLVIAAIVHVVAVHLY